jgi:cytochrome c peroxidase
MSTSKNSRVVVGAIMLGVLACSSPCLAARDDNSDSDLDRSLARMLHKAGFTGRVESTLQRRLGRPVNPKLADLGRLLWFDVLGGLHDDNTCGGCHSPSNGMGDTQSIAIGIQNNNLVGPHRRGPRNQRRTPSATGRQFPRLMYPDVFAAPYGQMNGGVWQRRLGRDERPGVPGV